MIHIKNLVLNINIETPISILGKTSEQQSDEYRKRIQVEDDMKANIISGVIYRQRLADWARVRFGDDVANTILGGGY